MSRREVRSSAIAAAAAWVSYATVEAMFAVVLPHALFQSSYAKPSVPFTMLLFAAYPVLGALLGTAVALAASATGRPAITRDAVVRWQAAFIAIACTANAVVLPPYTQTFAFLLGAAIVVASAFRLDVMANAWTVSVMMLAPLWVVRDVAEQHSTTWKAAVAAGLVLAVIAISFGVSRLRWRPRPWLPWAAVTALALILSGPSVRASEVTAPPPRGRLPNIVFVVMDTVRADHLSLYGYGRRTTPHLEEFASHATLYTRAYSPSNATLPTHASWFTGLWPSEHGAHMDFGGWWQPLRPGTTTVAEVLSARGWITASVAANYNFLGQGFGLDRGFQYVDARPAPSTPFGLTPPYTLRARAAGWIDHIGAFTTRRMLKRSAGEINASVMPLLDRFRAGGRPFFLYVNYMDAHSLCNPPEPWASKFDTAHARLSSEYFNTVLAAFHEGRPAHVTADEQRFFLSRYDGAIAYEDAQFGALIDALQSHDLLQDTLVILAADHGESFGERGIIGHSTSTYDDQIHVPLIVKWPGQQASAIESEPVTTMRIHDWILAAAHVRTEPPAGRVVSEAFPLYQRDRSGTLTRSGRAVISGPYKLIEGVGGEEELYNLIDDPLEMHNLRGAPEMQAVVAPLQAALTGWVRARRPADVASPELRRVSGAAEQRLRSLGYVR